MKLSRLRLRIGHDGKSWPVLLLLLGVVMIPTVGVLWFMDQAMRNEQLAMRQKLSDIYHAQLVGVQQELELYWQARSIQLEIQDVSGQDSEAPASRVFAERVQRGLADSIVVYQKNGLPAYPAPASPLEIDLGPLSSVWRRAERLERSGQNAAAAERFASVADRTTNRHLAARALQAQARCLVQIGQTQAAISVLSDTLSRPVYATAVSPQGRLIAPSAQLRALQLIEDPTDPTFQQIAKALSERLTRYDDPTLPAAQRLFLMKQLEKELGTLLLDSQSAASNFKMQQAEQLAARYLESDPPAPPTTSLQPSGLPDVWHLASPSGSVVALFDQQQLVQALESLVERHSLPDTASVGLLLPGAEPPDTFLVSLPAGGFLQDWQLVLHPEGQAYTIRQRTQAYLLKGILIVGVIFLLTLLIARLVQQQLKLTRLKNDLLSTVSHELKTPLASIRLLVDTLLESGVDDGQRVREYLQLIAKENVRLSRLVDNFLTFSRMEQDRQSFEKTPVSATAVVEEAAASVAERFNSSGCRFEIQIPADLPTLMADFDALVTVLLNLLDNAYKYSNEEKHIVLRSYCERGSCERGSSENDQVCFAVEDDGIGLSTRVAGKIFDRFYQVDQSLSRPGSGCGLGLSIVQFIVKAHGGSVAVDSRPGEGSTFTVRLPVATDQQQLPKEPAYASR